MTTFQNVETSLFLKNYSKICQSTSGTTPLGVSSKDLIGSDSEDFTTHRLIVIEMK